MPVALLEEVAAAAVRGQTRVVAKARMIRIHDVVSFFEQSRHAQVPSNLRDAHEICRAQGLPAAKVNITMSRKPSLTLTGLEP